MEIKKKGKERKRSKFYILNNCKTSLLIGRKKFRRNEEKILIIKTPRRKCWIIRKSFV
jgi:hypothetical protein